jgi:hypothetical protein
VDRCHPLLHAIRSSARKPALPGLDTYWGNVMLPVYNIGLLSSPCTDLDDLRSRIEPLRAFAEERGKPWLFTPANAWLPEGGGSLLESMGFMETMRLTGMVATELTSPSRQVTAEIRQLSGSEGAVVMGRLNCAAYGMPLEWADETDWADFFGPDVFTYAMQEDGADVSTATVFVIEDCLNVVAVATLPEFQRKGLCRGGHATCAPTSVASDGPDPDGAACQRCRTSLYERMGYRAVAGIRRVDARARVKVLRYTHIQHEKACLVVPVLAWFVFCCATGGATAAELPRRLPPRSKSTNRRQCW